MWEWRAFGPPGRLPEPARTREPLADEDRRADLYLLLDGRPDVGLKVRSLGLSEKCELKRRYGRHPRGLEHWEKVFAERLPLEPLWLRALAGYLDVGDAVLAPGAARLLELEQLCVASQLGRPRLVRVDKTIRKAPIPPAYTIESCELEISFSDRKPFHCRSIALEAPTLEIGLEIGQIVGFPISNADPDVLVAGYPEALLVLTR